MDDSVVYPTTSQRLIGEPNEQKKRREQETEKYLAEKPLIAETVKHLQRRIEFFHDIDSITETKDSENFMRQVAVNKMVAAVLTQEIKRLEVIIKAHSKK